MFTVPANAILDGKLGLIPNDQSTITVSVSLLLSSKRKKKCINYSIINIYHVDVWSIFLKKYKKHKNYVHTTYKKIKIKFLQ